MRKLPFKEILTNDLFLPLLLLVIYVAFLVVARGVMPTADEIIGDFANLYSRFGYEIIFASAFLEALVVINLVVPGQVALVLGVLFSRTGQTELPLVIFSACLGANLGYLIDYSIGYFGFADLVRKAGYGSLLDQAKAKLLKFSKKGLIVGFFHTNVGSFVSLAAGTIQLSLVTFLFIAALSSVFWAIGWSILIYSFGEVFLTLIKRYSFLFVVFIIAGLFLNKVWGDKKE